MPTLSLIDEKGYNAQINCQIVLGDGNILLAGEDGMIKIIEIKSDSKNKNEPNEIRFAELKLEKMLDSDGYLANIEDVKELENGDIICVETLGNIGIYEKDTWKLKIINSAEQNKNIKSDCIYFMELKNKEEVELWGEKNIKYKIKI